MKFMRVKQLPMHRRTACPRPAMKKKDRHTIWIAGLFIINRVAITFQIAFGKCRKGCIKPILLIIRRRHDAP